MSWEDCGLYWAWRGGPEKYCEPPTEKTIVYELVDGAVPHWRAISVIDTNKNSMRSLKWQREQT